MSANIQRALDGISRALQMAAAILAIVAAAARPGAAVDDVLLQTLGGKIVTGIVDDNTFVATLGHRVFRQQFLSNFRSANPGFVSLETGDASMPAGAEGFPSNHDVTFDLLPMTIGCASSNLLFWDGSDLSNDGLDLSDVMFNAPSNTSWDVFDANFNMFSADGSNQLVPGGLIAQTSSDIDPFDGVDTGSVHNHLVLQLSDTDGNSGTLPAQGVYMIAWQARSEGFESSDPFFLVLRTSSVSNAVRDFAAGWVEANINSLLAPPGVPGDYNGNSVVDAADYVMWRKTDGQVGQDLAADGNRNGDVDDIDYALWRRHFGHSCTISSGGSSVAVPEPASCALTLLLVVLVPAARRRRNTLQEYS